MTTYIVHVDSESLNVDYRSEFPNFEEALLFFDSKVGKVIREFDFDLKEYDGPAEVLSKLSYSFTDTITGGPSDDSGEITFTASELDTSFAFTAAEITLYVTK